MAAGSAGKMCSWLECTSRRTCAAARKAAGSIEYNLDHAAPHVIDVHQSEQQPPAVGHRAEAVGLLCGGCLVGYRMPPRHCSQWLGGS